MYQLLPTSADQTAARTSLFGASWSRPGRSAIIAAAVVALLTLNGLVLLWSHSSTTTVTDATASAGSESPQDDHHTTSPSTPWDGSLQPDKHCDLEEPSLFVCDPAKSAVKHTIPNLAHFAYVYDDPNHEITITFSQFLSVWSAHHFWSPDKLYWHTNANNASVERARNGESGKWSQLLLNLPNMVVNQVEAPTHAGNGKKLENLAHRSDFVRVQAVHDFGGVYIDVDVFPLYDIKHLRERGFAFVGGRGCTGDMQSGTFMSIKGGKMITNWLKGMHEVYDGQWLTHSDQQMTKTVKPLQTNHECETLVLRQIALAPQGWFGHDVDDLFKLHDDVGKIAKPDADDAKAALVDSLPELDYQAERPEWARDWSCSYLLHAFNSFEKDGIFPSAVIERRSNIHRAVYPAVREMLKQGVVTLDDTEEGK